MADAKHYTYTSLAGESSVTLEVDGKVFTVSKVVASFALRQIPEAVCVLAVGRDARTMARSTLHTEARKLRAMTPAKIIFRAAGEYAAGKPWPDKAVTIFEGYFVGFGYQKAQGSINFVAHLTHWLVDLGFTSVLSQISHPMNPVRYDTFPAVTEGYPSGEGGGTGSGDTGSLLGTLIDSTAARDLAPTDAWGAIRTLLCQVSQAVGFTPVVGPLADVVDTLTQNNRAGRALARMEGPEGTCAGFASTGYKYAVPIPLTSGFEDAGSYLSDALGRLPVLEIAHQTTWDLLIGYYCPSFGLDICPLVDRAVVTASLPGYRGKNGTYWRTLDVDDYASVDETTMIPKPLRAVVVHGDVSMDDGFGSTATAKGAGGDLAGVFVSPVARDADGAVLYLPVPEWIGELTLSGDNAGASTGVTTGAPTNTATTPGNGSPPPAPTPADVVPTLRDILNAYARMLYAENCLRGRSGTLVGPLRFDIGPGSHVKLVGSPDLFLAGEDDSLAGSRFAQVNRVTVVIDAEARQASTSLVLTHLRNEQENKDDGTSLDAHPFYGDAVMLGAPLVPDLEFPP